MIIRKLTGRYAWCQLHYHRSAIIFTIGGELGSTCSDDISERWTSLHLKFHFLFWGLTASFPVSHIRKFQPKETK